MHAQAEAVALVRGALPALQTPGAPPAAILRAAAAHLRGRVLEAGNMMTARHFGRHAGVDSALGVDERGVQVPPPAGAGAAAASPPLAAEERAFLEDCMRCSTLGYLAVAIEPGVPVAAPTLAVMVAQAQRRAAAWAAPAAAAALAARLAARGVARGERAAADLRAVLLQSAAALVLRHEIVGKGAMPPGVTLTALMEAALAANPDEYGIAADLAHEHFDAGDARASYQCAMRALARVGPEPAGSGLVAPRLLSIAARALVYGALGPWWRLAAVRPLLARALRLLDGNRRWLPRASCEGVAGVVAAAHADFVASAVASAARQGCPEDADIAALKIDWAKLSLEVVAANRRCAAAGCRATSFEMRRCSRCCAAWYCSPACQKAHWPEHRGACEAAATP
jgi:hypothetical protein